MNTKNSCSVPYNVNVESIAIDISDLVRKQILLFLEDYAFPYSSSINDKQVAGEVLVEHFRKRKSIGWLREQLSLICYKRRGIEMNARGETNRLHTMGLGRVLLGMGLSKCTTVHSYGISGK
jgi:hypothetical protein